MGAHSNSCRGGGSLPPPFALHPSSPLSSLILPSVHSHPLHSAFSSPLQSAPLNSASESVWGSIVSPPARSGGRAPAPNAFRYILSQWQMSGGNDLSSFCANQNVVTEANRTCTFARGRQVPPLAMASAPCHGKCPLAMPAGGHPTYYTTTAVCHWYWLLVLTQTLSLILNSNCSEWWLVNSRCTNLCTGCCKSSFHVSSLDDRCFWRHIITQILHNSTYIINWLIS